MNHANCKKWLQEKIIPNLESKSDTVVDNEFYRNVEFNWHTTSHPRKGEMVFWLDKHGIWYSSDMKKEEMYNLMKMHKLQYETSAIDCFHNKETTELTVSTVRKVSYGNRC
jgi:hypothetical protein